MRVDPDQVWQNIRRNVVANYLAVVFRTVRGLVAFRLLYQGLGAEEFGYWALLWSIFGYGVLLDFGFGITVQKSVAQMVALKRWDELNRTLSTILLLYLGIGTVMVVIGFSATDLWTGWVEISAGNRARFGEIFTLFVCVMGLMFPLAVFPEILRGQQRIALVNWLNICSGALGLGLICVALWLDWGFFAIVGIALGETVLPALIAVVFAFVHTPGLRLSPRLFSRRSLGEVAEGRSGRPQLHRARRTGAAGGAPLCPLGRGRTARSQRDARPRSPVAAADGARRGRRRMGERHWL